MTSKRHDRCCGFSLVELAIVLGVISAIIGGIWSYASTARQTANVEQSVEAISLITDATRSAYAGAAGISGGTSIVVPQLTKTGAMPTHVLRNSQTACGGVTTNYADSPLASNLSSYACGTIQVCNWGYATQAGSICIAADTSNASQYFAIEFDGLDFPSCVALVGRISPTIPTTGLKDIYINSHSGVSQLGGLPIPPSAAMSTPPAYAGLGCTPNNFANTVDLVYSLRAPST